MLGRVVPRRGILVVKDPPANLPQLMVPGVLGITIIKECYHEFFMQHGATLFDLPIVSQASSSWYNAFQHCH